MILLFTSLIFLSKFNIVINIYDVVLDALVIYAFCIFQFQT